MSNGFLSQEEINSLLNGESGNDDTNTGNTNSSEEELTANEMDMLGEIGNISMGSASTALYQIINQKVNITTPVVSITTLGEVKKTFDAPTVVLDVEYTTGMVGRNILIIRIEDAAVIANLMMGGDGKVETHELSEIEISAVAEAMNQMIGSAATSMATMFSRKVDISPPASKLWKDENDILTDSIPEDEKIVKISFRMTIGDLVDSNIMQVLPISTAKKIGAIMMGTEEEMSDDSAPTQAAATPETTPVVEAKPIVETPKQQPPSQPQVAPPEQPVYQAPPQQTTPVEVHKAQFEPLVPSSGKPLPENIDLILDVPLNISVVLGRTKKSIKDVLELGTGSLIELDKLAEEPVEILVNGKRIAFGEVVVIDENFGVRITSIVSNDERIKSLG
jgi:flagellar motor switch protein FliN/FliY